ncbi:uncharacterized protein PG986_014277 [Apiospora aurea]|uniref:Uncharacterized protein n=1 Tax=Apiospora aurea TaxID=335848 RepID=A0ABR1PSI6_9PEZI
MCLRSNADRKTDILNQEAKRKDTSTKTKGRDGGGAVGRSSAFGLRARFCFAKAVPWVVRKSYDKIDLIFRVFNKNSEETVSPFIEGGTAADSGFLKRAVGHICAAPEYEVCESKGPVNPESSERVGILHDWVLIQLGDSNFRFASNKIYIGPEGVERLVENFENGPDVAVEVPPIYAYDAARLRLKLTNNDNFLQMEDHLTRTIEDMHGTGKPGVKCVRVVKRGRTTGLTFRVTNAIEAVVREKVVLKRNNFGQPIGKDKSDGGVRSRFSEHGDSGAAVLSIDGTFMGPVVSGGPARPGEYNARPLVDERKWRGQAEGSGDPGKPTRFEKGNMPHKVRPGDPELPPFEMGMDITFVHMAWALLGDIERWTGKKPSIYFLP